MHLQSICPSGNKGSHEATSFHTHITKPHDLMEVTQQHHRHKNATSTAKLDRFYINHHPLDQLDHSFHCTALACNPELSNHRAIRLTKTNNSKRNYTTLPTHHIKHPEWPHKVQRHYQELLKLHPTQDQPQHKRPPTRLHPLRQLRTYKEAMWLTSQQLQEGETQHNQGPSNPTTNDALLSHMLSTISHSTKYDSHTRPPWAYLEEQHPAAEEWTKALNITSQASRTQTLKDMAFIHFQQTTIHETQQQHQEQQHHEQPTHTQQSPTLHMGKTTQNQAGQAPPTWLNRQPRRHGGRPRQHYNRHHTHGGTTP